MQKIHNEAAKKKRIKEFSKYEERKKNENKKLRVEFKRQLKIIADIHGHDYAEQTKKREAESFIFTSCMNTLKLVKVKIKKTTKNRLSHLSRKIRN